MIHRAWTFLRDAWRTAVEFDRQAEKVALMLVIADGIAHEAGIDIEREHIKVGMMGGNVKQIASCYHDWMPRPGIIHGYIRVDAQCTKCETWWTLPTERD